MDATFSKTRVLRRPQWRADRVIELVDNPRLQLRRSDDAYIRSYRRYQILRSAAGIDKTKRFRAFLSQPHSCVADAIYFASNTERRHILEAWLLIEEAPAEIASRLKIEEETVNHYEALFFDIRHRLYDTNWVKELILSPPEYLISRRNGEMSDTQRGFLYRMFGYCGGPAALDSVVSSLARTAMSANRESVGSWLDNAAEQIVQSLSGGATHPRPIQDAVVQLLDLALEPQRTARTSKAARKRPPSDFEAFVAAIIAKLPGRSTSEFGRRRQRGTAMSNLLSRELANDSESTS
jgi:hypothetical protein